MGQARHNGACVLGKHKAEGSTLCMQIVCAYVYATACMYVGYCMRKRVPAYEGEGPQSDRRPHPQVANAGIVKAAPFLDMSEQVSGWVGGGWAQEEEPRRVLAGLKEKERTRVHRLDRGNRL